MTAILECPWCKKLYTLNDESRLSEKFTCKNCGSELSAFKGAIPSDKASSAINLSSTTAPKSRKLVYIVSACVLVLVIAIWAGSSSKEKTAAKYLTIANDFYKKQDWEQAIDYYNRYLGIVKNDATVQNMLAECKKNAGQNKKELLEQLAKANDGKNKPVKYISSLEKEPLPVVNDVPSIVERIAPSVFLISTYDVFGKELATGTGFFINKDGDFITNFHVLEGAGKAHIKTKNGGTYNIRSIIAQYEDLDLIIGRADILDKTPIPVPFCTSLPEIGEKIVVIGNPFGLEQSVTDGIVSAIRETKSAERTIIQISAPISPGSSGSPVVNMKGEVVGVATFQLIVGQNLNFAVACDKNFVETLKKEEIPFSKWSSEQVGKMTFIGENTQGYKEYRHELTGMVFVQIPAGTFKMGANDGGADEEPVHEVTLDSFLISKYEVTQEVWQKIMGNNPSSFKGNQNPVEQVSWNNCQDFCRKTSLRLPTEAEWEYACKAGTTTKYYWGDKEDGNYMWYASNSGNTTHPTGQKKPNGYGLYDMSGNVWEWCKDLYDASYYQKSPKSNPKGPDTGQLRMLRGGSFFGSAYVCRSARRLPFLPSFENHDIIGFRVVLSSK